MRKHKTPASKDCHRAGDAQLCTESKIIEMECKICSTPGSPVVPPRPGVQLTRPRVLSEAVEAVFWSRNALCQKGSLLLVALA